MRSWPIHVLRGALSAAAGPARAQETDVEALLARLETHAEAGNHGAKYQVGAFLAELGRAAEALRWLKCAADGGNGNAVRVLSALRGDRVADPTYALEWAEEAPRK